ncbi:hypothetical protein HYD_4840 [Candidatus Hydrogenosomobacter endosymbioticus]|uniref:Uncharacterized protein n=2 Tax=Candidatus Hydrogenosomobacter endosymbioticus TaxID=2558174 RepID=A0ABM7V988_9PROT|nr:hypothetical protein HYD_4840 [Candidatus Hydrogenosomobacter endosymbioticus]
MEKDKILSINIPGIIAASGAQAFGMVWCCGSYKPYLDMENRNNTEKVYTLLKDDVFYDDLKQNFFSKLVKHENPPSTICIGTFSHYQDAHDNNTVSSLTLSGPYMLRD